MKIIDLSHPISEDMPVYPGTEPPTLSIGCSIADDGFMEKKITMYSHTGTHVDAPAHLIDGGTTLDLLPIDRFSGPAVTIDITSPARRDQSRSIRLEELTASESSIARADFVLIHTGWCRYWGTDAYFTGYPALSAEAAEWLAGFRLKGIGFDTISADPEDTTDFPVHKAFLRNDTVIIENLNSLDQISGFQTMFSCFPLLLHEADGSPVRAVAFSTDGNVFPGRE